MASEAGKPGTFQFNQTPDEILGRPKESVPEHIKGMDVLGDGTKKQLAALEAQLTQAKGPAPPAPDPNQPPVMATPTLTPVQPTAPAVPAPAGDPGSAPREEMAKDLEPEPGDGGYLDFVGDDQDVLNNDELRESIEARNQPLSLGDLILTGRARQRVPIVPGEFEVVFQTTSGLEDLFVKDQLLGITGTNLSVQQRYADMNLALGLVSLNAETGPDPYREGKLVKELFDARVEWLRGKPVPLLASLHINYAWFETRTRKLFAFRGDKQMATDAAGVEQG